MSKKTYAIFLTLAVLAFLSFALPVQATNWVLGSSGSTAVLLNMDMLDHKFGLAVGGLGTVLKTTDGGNSWTSVGGLSSSVNLYDVDVVDQNTAWAVGLQGSSGIVLKTTNGGNTWVMQFPQTPADIPKLNSVFFFDTFTGFAVGLSGTIWQTTDGGTNWVEKNSGTSQDFNSVTGGVIFGSVVTRAVWAVGQSGAILRSIQLTPSSSWTTWAAQSAPTILTLADVSVFASSATHLSLLATGIGGIILRTTDSGATWTKITSPVTTNSLVSAKLAGSQGFIVGSGGVILKTIDSGASWASISSPTTNILYGLSAQNSGSYLTAVAVGLDGTIVRYEEIPPSQPSSVQKTTAIGDNTPTMQWGTSFDNPGDGFIGTGIAKYEFQNDGLSFVNAGLNTSVNIQSAQADGSHTFAVRAVDAAGNTGSLNTLSYTIDTTAPAVGAVTPVAVTAGSAQTFSATYSDTVGVTNCWFYVNDALQGTMSLSGTTSGSASKSHTFSSAGSYSVKVGCNDGNYDGWGTPITVVVSAAAVPDTTAPDTTISNKPSSSTTNISATFGFSANESATFDCKLDTNVFFSCVSPANYSNLSSGSHTFQVRAIDAAGNVDATPDSYTWTITGNAIGDTVAPSVGSVTPATAVATYSQSFTASFSDSVGVVSCNLYVDSIDQGLMTLAGTTSGSASREYSFSSATSHTLQARCSDAAGNVGLGALTTVSVSAAPAVAADTAAPSTPPGLQKISNEADATPTFAWNATSDNIGVTSYLIQIDNGSLIDNGGSTSYTIPSNLANGTHSFKVLAKDAAGNTSPTSSFTFTVNASTVAVSCPLTMEKAYKSSASKAVYYITTDCTKRPFKNGSSFFTYFDSWSEVITTTQTILNSIANDQLGFTPAGPKYDPKYGALVKIVTDPKVYLLLGTEKYWIISESVFTGLKYDWKWIEDVDPGLLNKYSIGSEITYTDHHPNYTIIKYAGFANTYRLEPDPDDYSKQVKRWIKNEKVFNALKFRWDRIVTVPASEVYKDGKIMDESEVNL
ncbi:MAG TPA: hypothetical protein DEB73_01880 [Candidatus Magasanikbacteria bacterium]|uniref:OmpA domain protein n=2 Tax=Candidatus Magasanikiibacteriota TaxID=1752731 RepID=A0A0G0WKG5_9BACT|nr:MAG: OmpA domain protein [Candidatus Magasanikbacteria bacterium GW2011_GWC2_41_17]KKS13320.1 MAG: OmpA domain protein [Candidatus Magasanikbacteria bacterium GW2011_GWA2_41_55]HBV57991.1 hypothetical protein [Candidatus Magasanikbacteria bacterium]HBX16325.1 hypothetical protein [Candidatus Magasanikbacteria bacterium]